MVSDTSEHMLGRRSAAPWIIGGVVAFVMLLVIAGVGSVVWFGMDVFHDQAKTAIRADPAVVEAVGGISGIRFDFAATGAATGEDEFAYRVEGARSSGLLVGRFVTVDADTEDLREGSLRLDDGRVIPIGSALHSD